MTAPPAKVARIEGGTGGAPRGGSTGPIPEQIAHFFDVLMSQFPDGFSVEALRTRRQQADLPFPREAFVSAFRALIDQGRLHHDTTANLFVPVNPNSRGAGGPPGLTDDERIAYQVVADAGDQGALLQRVREQTRLTNAPKILQALAKKGLIKQVKSVRDRTAKLYMLTSLAPAESVTGGLWYTEAREFNTPLVRAVSTAVFRVIQRSPNGATIPEITQGILTAGAAAAAGGGTMTAQHVRSIVELLLGDAVIEEVVEADGQPRYRQATVPRAVGTPWTAVPCASCAFLAECHPGGVVNPEECRYMARWLDW